MSNDLRLTTETLSTRLQSYTRDSYHYVFSIMKGIALGFAMLVVFSILDKPGDCLARLSLWVASGAAVLVSHLTVSRGILLTSYRFNFLDTLAPFLLGFLEFLLFGILQRWKGHQEWFYFWYLIFAMHAVVAVVLVTNRLRSTRVEEEFAPNLKPLAIEYLSWLRGDRKAAVIIAAVSAFVWVLLVPCGLSSHVNKWVHVGLGIFASLSLAPVILKAERERTLIVGFLVGKNGAVKKGNGGENRDSDH